MYRIFAYSFAVASAAVLMLGSAATASASIADHIGGLLSTGSAGAGSSISIGDNDQDSTDRDE
ncbi:hypothetical protein [Nocardia sp. NPDC050435]|uniref:hypothetical protein n=1 Tax=Nocardia sp. NPDC050435 TaxID=3155040 RepID=UPI0033D331BE